VAKLAPVNPSVLTWAMAEAGLNITTLAERAKLSPDRVSSFVTGDDQPKTGEFRQLAKALQRSLAFFFMPHPPQHSPMVASFRQPSGNEGARSLNPAELAALRSVARWQRVVAWIRQKNEDPSPILLKVSRDSTVSATATAIATWLH
jgi:hypothetical protein